MKPDKTHSLDKFKKATHCLLEWSLLKAILSDNIVLIGRFWAQSVGVSTSMVGNDAPTHLCHTPRPPLGGLNILEVQLDEIL